MRKIVRLDVKNNYVVKGRKLEGYRKIGEVIPFSRKVCSMRVELLYLDVVASLFERNSVIKQLPELLKDSFIPVTVGGGIDTSEKADECFRCGVDRIAVNSASFKNPEVLSYISSKYGSQAAISHIEAKQIDGKWCAMYETGREIGSFNLVKHLEFVQSLGVGEILLSSVENDGMLNGFPESLLEVIKSTVTVPIIISGGQSNFELNDNLTKFPFVKGVCLSRAIIEHFE